jgi:hypothetical protein
MRAGSVWLGFVGALSLGLAGCTAEGPDYVPAAFGSAEANAGIIYVYRPLGTVGTRGESPFVSINGKSYGAMKAGSYIAVPMPPGEYRVTVQQSMLMMVPTIPRWVTVDVAPGSRSYVKVNQKIDDVKFGGGLTVMQSVDIEEMSAEEGQKELTETKLNG